MSRACGFWGPINWHVKSSHQLTVSACHDRMLSPRRLFWLRPRLVRVLLSQLQLSPPPMMKLKLCLMALWQQQPSQLQPSQPRPSLLQPCQRQLSQPRPSLLQPCQRQLSLLQPCQRQLSQRQLSLLQPCQRQLSQPRPSLLQHLSDLTSKNKDKVIGNTEVSYAHDSCPNIVNLR